jgi:hypothetical protein
LKEVRNVEVGKLKEEEEEEEEESLVPSTSDSTVLDGPVPSSYFLIFFK